MGTPTLAVATILTGIALVACQDPEVPGGTGRLALDVVAPAGACGPVESGRVQVRGPTDATVTIAPGATATIDNLQPGIYTVGLEGLIAGEVDCFGQTSGIQVTEGQQTRVVVTQASFAASLSSLLGLQGSKTLSMSFNAVAGASSYEVEAATDSTFTVNHVTQSTTQTSVQLTVPTFGQYLVRVRAVDPYQGRGRPSIGVLFPVTCDCWTTKAPMPTARRSLAVGAVNGVIYAIGGLGNTSVLSTVEAYDPITNEWTTKAPMPTPRYDLAVGVVNGILYAVGGHAQGGAVLSTVEAYNPVANAWSAKAVMPTARFGLAVGVANGVLYAVGGNSGSSTLSTVEAYDPLSNTWATRTVKPNASDFFGVGTIDSLLFAVGPNVRFEAYDAMTNTWTSRVSAMQLRTNWAVGVVYGVVYAMGGGIKDVEGYSPATNRWTAKAPMPSVHSLSAVGVVNGQLYVLGGFDGSSILSRIDAYDP